MLCDVMCFSCAFMRSYAIYMHSLRTTRCTLGPLGLPSALAYWLLLSLLSFRLVCGVLSRVLLHHQDVKQQLRSSLP